MALRLLDAHVSPPTRVCHPSAELLLCRLLSPTPLLGVGHRSMGSTALQGPACGGAWSPHLRPLPGHRDSHKVCLHPLCGCTELFFCCVTRACRCPSQGQARPTPAPTPMGHTPLCHRPSGLPAVSPYPPLLSWPRWAPAPPATEIRLHHSVPVPQLLRAGPAPPAAAWAPDRSTQGAGHLQSSSP
ncbi:hypothetical protein NDU88_007280 [Pleurodeles waltl]|uniref:Uncharacterized protein n=1 Tax=Pleurodeles waltl TaxID=8319 RepID=A0AAV7RP03_PLEWA|nr:hypothetical protein NDU88_007280 [Pleurodeles waltl]